MNTFLMRWLARVILGLALLAGARAARADTVLSDTLWPTVGHTFTLTPEGSPYLCDVVAFVLPGDTLRALAGTVVHFGQGGGLLVQGTILSEGTAGNLVRFDKNINSVDRWHGIQIRQVMGADTTRCTFTYTKITGSAIAFNAIRPVPAGEQYCVEFNHCAIDSSNLGLICFYPGAGRIFNCVFNEIRTFCVYANNSVIDLRNCAFLPNPLNPVYSYGVLLYDADYEVNEHIKYNSFYGGADGLWTNFVNTYHTGDGQYTLVDLDSTNVLGDPLLDGNYYPDVSSPLIDAGDPALQDPDLTRSDIGMNWFLGNVLPCRFVSEAPAPAAWVQGFGYLGMIDVEAYPPADWTLLEGPPGLQVVQLNRTRLALTWPISEQLAGIFPVVVSGVNQVNQFTYTDTLTAQLDFSVNHAPHLNLVLPCPAGDCLDQDSVVVGATAGASIQVRLHVLDEDAARLGAAQSYRLDLNQNGANHPTIFADSLRLDLALDTARVDLRMRFSDGRLADSLFMSIRPRYTLLSGDVSGVIGTETGAVFLTGPLRVPAGQQLLVEAGSRVVAGEGDPGEWLIDVEGELVLEGTVESPISFQSQATHTRDVDRRPPFLRLLAGAQVSGLAHLDLSGFSTAIQLEHLEREEPLLIEDCRFSRTRVGVLAIRTPVEILHCRFEEPADTLLLGSYGVYLTGSQGNLVRNNLFINPIVGLEVVDAEVQVANNSFQLTPRIFGVYQQWPLTSQLGFGRVQVLNSNVDLRNNLFQWRSPLYGESFADIQLEDFLDGAPRAVWLDLESQVRSSYNWFNCRNGWMRQGDTLNAPPPVNMTHLAAFNDSLLLITDLRAGLDSARVDEAMDFRLFADSPLIDAGDPDPLWNDAFDASRCDIGWRGGPLALSNEYTAVSDAGPRPPDLAELPSRFRLRPPWPNPFNPRTRLEVELDQAGTLDLRVYDLLGREVAVLARDVLEAGVYRLELDASGWASGSYYARARFGGEQQTVRLLLLK